jgi:hypothetical protein
MISFEYRGFYDVPQGIVASYQGRRFLLERLFDEEVDEYQDFYSAYDISHLIGARGDDLWNNLSGGERKFICTIPVKKVQFDHSKRSAIHSSVFQTLLAQENSDHHTDKSGEVD